MSKFREEINAVYESILEFGGRFPVTRESEERIYDPVAGTFSDTPQVTGELLALILPVSSAFVGEKVGIVFDESLIKSETKVVFASVKGSTIEPEVGDKLEYNNKTWSVSGVDTLAPDGVSKIMHNLVINVST